MLTHSKTSVRPVVGKSLDDLAGEWDKIAHIRRQQVTGGKDLSFKYVLLPVIRQLLADCSLAQVIDLGCGIGELTRELAEVSGRIVGVDASPRSIAIAREIYAANIPFHTDDVSDFARRWPGQPFTAAVANMSLMTCLDLGAFVQAAAGLLAPQGCFIATITHPWFWPYYWGYADADWFNYNQEIVLEAPFRISEEATDCVTTHVHRPLSAYLNTMAKAGFVVDSILEPYPEESVHALYPERWEFPRFLAFRAIKATV